jgi:Mrp family chromosome partitioning ATPase
LTDPNASDLRAAARALWRRKALVLAFALVGLAAGWLVRDDDVQYRTTALADVGRPTVTANPFAEADAAQEREFVPTEVQVLQSVEMRRAVQERIGRPAQTIGRVTIDNVPDTSVVRIRVASSDRDLTAAVANAYIDVYVENRAAEALALARTNAAALERQAFALGAEIAEVEGRIVEESARLDDSVARVPDRSQLTALTTRYGTLIDRQATFSRLAQEYRVVEELGVHGVRVVSRAEIPEKPFSEPGLTSVLVAGLLALVAGCAAVLLLRSLDDRLADREELEELFPFVPVLAVAPTVRRGRSANALLRGNAGAAHRALRAQLRLAPGVVRSVVVTSATSDDGRGATALGLAVAARAAGEDVAVVDGDLRRPTLGAWLDGGNGPGLAGAITTRVPLPSVVDVVDVPDVGELTFVPAGADGAEAADRLDAERVHALLERMRRDHELVVIHAPPVLAVVDALLLARSADGVVLAVELGETRTADLRSALQLLERHRIPVIGLVATGVGRSFRMARAPRTRPASPQPSTRAVAPLVESA